MKTTRLTHDRALRRAVAAATLAPSVHNTQPWRFALLGNGLELLADGERQLTVLDPTGRQLHLSLGCALLNTRVSLAAAGCATRVDRFPDPARPAVVAHIDVVAGEPDAHLATLEPEIARRQTNRRRFADDNVPDELVQQWMEAAAAEGAVLHPVRSAEERQALARLSQRADAAQIGDPAYRAELRAWTTNDPARRDGVRAAVVPHVDGTAGDEVPIRDFDSQGAGWLPAQTRSSANQCLLLLGTRGENAESWLCGGAALQRVWLELTRAGYVASLFTQPIEVAAIRVQMRHELRLPMHPHLLMRVGHAEATPATLRRHVDEVLDDCTGS